MITDHYENMNRAPSTVSPELPSTEGLSILKNEKLDLMVWKDVISRNTHHVL